MSSGNKIMIIPVGLALVMLFSQINLSHAQSTNQQTITGFKIYENPDYNIQIQYPRSWEKSEQDLPANTIVSFSAPDTKDLSAPALLLISNFQMSNDTNLDEFVDFFFKERYLKPTDYRFVSSTNTRLMDMPAREFILYDYNKDKILGTESTLKVMRVLSFDNKTGNGYSIKYATQPGLFNKYLPAAEKMIGSFDTGVGNLNINMPVTSSNNVPSIITPPVQNMVSEGPENKFILKWGSPGTANGQFHDPADLAVDSTNGFVYVADLLNNRIQKFDTEGKYLSKWGSYGSADGQFSHPGDVAVSSWGEIFVADIDNARIEKFDSNMTFVSKWGIFGTEDGQFNHPGDIAFDSANRTIFVVDTDNNRI